MKCQLQSYQHRPQLCKQLFDKYGFSFGCRKNPFRDVGQQKVLCSHHQKTSLILRENSRSMMMWKTRRKKATEITAKSASRKTNKAQISNCFKKITVIVGWRCGYLHDLHAKFSSQIYQKHFHREQQAPKTVSFEVCQHDIKLFHVPKLQLRWCQC